MASIPASTIVQVNPGVIASGGSALDLSGLILTGSTQPPVGTVQSFPTQAAVAAYFGASSAEAALATIYFLGYDNSTLKPANLLFAQYPTASVAGYLRGGSLAAMTLTELKALTGVLTIVCDGVSKTSSTITLTAATSFSNATTIMLAAFTTPGFTLTFDSVSSAFVATSSTTGAASTVAFATGSLAAGVKLTAATGAVTSAGAIASVPGTAMAAIVAQTQNFASFMTTVEPSVADEVLFAAWVSGQNNRFLYAMWDTTSAPATNSDTTSAGHLIRAASYSGTAPIWGATSRDKAAFLMGAVASLNFEATEGRATMAFRTQSGLAADVTDATTAANLIANGYNYYGAYATAAEDFTFFYPGSVSGAFLWLDSYVNQIQLNNALQSALLNLLINTTSIPYNAAGYGLIEAACAAPINAGLNFGTIRPGVTLSSSQIAAVNAAAGTAIAQTLTQRGWYLQVKDASAAARVARTSPPMTLWYMDGQAVQKLTLASIQVQ